MDDRDIEAYARSARRAVILCTVVTVTTFGFLLLGSHHIGVVAGLVVGLVWLYAGIRWIQWFWWAYRIVIEAGRARFARWVSFWGWVVPGLAAFAPRWLAEDLWRAPDSPGTQRSLPDEVHTWWVLWCIADLLRLVDRSPRGGSVPSAIAGVLILVSTPWAVATIRILTERVVALQVIVREAERAARRQAAEA